ncbi:helix-turn-helix domain-containing protein [Streptomyces sp. bgisy100]|uniref:helix-turn-helix domain-containing protein n=1 Tax=Streptomyces sp. bgisy100 TaxID=3413783 RepID=UPI003D723CC7
MAFDSKKLDPTANPFAFFGSELRRCREERGLSQAELGALLFVSKGYISQFETAFRRPEESMVERMDGALEVTGHLLRVYRMAVKAEHQRIELADYFAAIARLEPQATRIDWYGAALVPGLLQTPEYAAVITRASNPFRQPDEIAELVAARMKRAEILDRTQGGPRLLVILDEVALHRPIGGPTVMKEQLDHVADAARAAKAVVQILPTQAGAHPLIAGQLIVLHFADTPPVAYMEGPHGGQVLDKPEQVDTCLLSYHLTCAAAMSPDASLELIESVAREYGTNESLSA